MTKKRPEPSVDREIARRNGHRRRDDDHNHIGNDPLEVFIILTVLTAMAGGAYFMWLLSQQV